MNSWRRSTTRGLVAALLAVGALGGCSKGSGPGGTDGKTSKTTTPSSEQHG